jgi:XTP/dITP diphosphohydrolase
MELLIATRSTHKLREIQMLMREAPQLRVLDLLDAGLPEHPDEETIESFDTFEENALAKAKYFADRSGLPTAADDSGLEVDALGGRPGVHSKRFAPVGRGGGLKGEDRDRANTRYLLEQLGDLPLAERTARYVCVAVFIGPEGKAVSFRGEAEGLILGLPRGQSGFGYDPVFYDQSLGRTFAEITEREKSDRSHRGKAFRSLAMHLAGDGSLGGSRGRS